ncbi:MAG TPA: plasmid stabilization protein ParE [Prolixibacteraceae bacterium]|nr:plasmid stabilization protein ParE [Prolixibacteraceae bacterium]
MDTRKLKVVVSKQYSDDLKNIFQYGLETFGFAVAFSFYNNLEKLVSDLEFEHFMYPECRFLATKSKIYRNIILESYLIIYRITPYRIEVLRVFHSSICTSSKIRSVKKIKI